MPLKPHFWSYDEELNFIIITGIISIVSDQPVVSLETALTQFLLDLKNANKAPHTIRAYRSDISAFAQCSPELVRDITAQHLRDFFAQHIPFGFRLWIIL